MYIVLIPIAAVAISGLVWLINRGDGGSAADNTVPTSSVAAATTLDPNVPTTTLTPLPTTIAGAALTGATPCPAADGSSPRTVTFAQAPPSCTDKTKTYTAVVTTDKGAFTIALDAAAAPLTVNNFVVLARYHYF